MFSRQMDVDADADVGEGLGSLQNMIYNILDGERAPFKNLLVSNISGVVDSAW